MAISNSSKKTCTSQATLQTERLHLRGACEDDIEDFYEMFSDEDVMKYWSGPPHTQKSKTKDFLDFMISSPTNGTLDFVVVLSSTDKVIGKAGIWETINHEIGFMLNRSYWGKGFMAEALASLIPHIWEHNIEKIMADADPRNDASIGMLERFGFVEYAKEERTIETHLGWCDSVYLLLDRPRLEAEISKTVDKD